MGACRDDDNEYAAELRAIRKAVRVLRTQAPQSRQGSTKILTDCQRAMKSLRKASLAERAVVTYLGHCYCSAEVCRSLKYSDCVLTFFWRRNRCTILQGSSRRDKDKKQRI